MAIPFCDLDLWCILPPQKTAEGALGEIGQREQDEFLLQRIPRAGQIGLGLGGAGNDGGDPNGSAVALGKGHQMPRDGGIVFLGQGEGGQPLGIDGQQGMPRITQPPYRKAVVSIEVQGSLARQPTASQQYDEL